MAKAYRQTQVSPYKSQEYIERLLRKHGVDGVRWTSLTGEASLEFRLPRGDSSIGFHVGIEYIHESSRAQYMRALYWYIKAKLEAIEFGLVDFEKEFLPFLIIGPNRTVGDEVVERLAQGTIGCGVPLLPPAREDVYEG